MMPVRDLTIGVVTDEISRNLGEALDACAEWGISRLELREGQQQRFPAFTPDEVSLIDDWIRDGGEVATVSPGIFKGAATDAATIQRQLSDTLPRAIELAVRFTCPTVIAFGFERGADEPPETRDRVKEAFAAAADMAADAGLRVAIENEPAFWIDHPEPAVEMLREIGHPALGLNFDPANMHWGGRVPTRADLATVEPFLINLHVKDFAEGRPEAPWFPVGTGQTPWAELLEGVLLDTTLNAITLETHVVPLREASEQSLAALRQLVADARASAASTSS